MPIAHMELFGAAATQNVDKVNHRRKGLYIARKKAGIYVKLQKKKVAETPSRDASATSTI